MHRWTSHAALTRAEAEVKASMMTAQGLRTDEKVASSEEQSTPSSSRRPRAIDKLRSKPNASCCHDHGQRHPVQCRRLSQLEHTTPRTRNPHTSRDLPMHEKVRSWMPIDMEITGLVNSMPADQSLAATLQISDEPRVIASASEPYLICHTNRAWCEATGYTFLECVGKSLLTLIATWTADGSHEELKGLCDALASFRSHSTSLVSYRRDGTPFRSQMTCELIRGSTHIIGTLVVQPNTDGSQRQRDDLLTTSPAMPASPVCYTDAAHSRPSKRVRRAEKLRLADVLSNTTDPIVLCAKESPHVITHPNQPWLESMPTGFELARTPCPRGATSHRHATLAATPPRHRL